MEGTLLTTKQYVKDLVIYILKNWENAVTMGFDVR